MGGLFGGGGSSSTQTSRQATFFPSPEGIAASLGPLRTGAYDARAQLQPYQTASTGALGQLQSLLGIAQPTQAQYTPPVANLGTLSDELQGALASFKAPESFREGKMIGYGSQRMPVLDFYKQRATMGPRVQESVMEAHGFTGDENTKYIADPLRIASESIDAMINADSPEARAAAYDQVLANLATAEERLDVIGGGTPAYNYGLSEMGSDIARIRSALQTEQNRRIEEPNFGTGGVPQAQAEVATPQNLLDLIAADPGYQFQLQQGQDALAAQAAASGMGASGRALKEAQRYSQGLAGNQFQQAINNLMGLSQMGVPAAQQAAGIEQNLGTQIAGAIQDMNRQWYTSPWTNTSTATSESRPNIFGSLLGLGGLF